MSERHLGVFVASFWAGIVRTSAAFRARRHTGGTTPCAVCGAGFEPDPYHAEKIIDSVILRPSTT